MTKPVPVMTTSRPHGLEVGQYTTVTSTGGDRTYRVVEVPSPTTFRLDRPWWLPLSIGWGYVTSPFRALKNWVLRTFAP